jgi:hypothetical protein
LLSDRKTNSLDKKSKTSATTSSGFGCGKFALEHSELALCILVVINGLAFQPATTKGPNAIAID